MLCLASARRASLPSRWLNSAPRSGLGLPFPAIGPSVVREKSKTCDTHLPLHSSRTGSFVHSCGLCRCLRKEAGSSDVNSCQFIMTTYKTHPTNGIDAEPFKKKLAESARVRRVWNIACTCDLWIIFRITRSGSGYRQEPHPHGPTKTEDNMFASSPMTQLRYGETLFPTGIV